MPLETGVKRWGVLHVRPRTEKKMAGYCAHGGYEHYLPLRRETKIYQRRKVTVEKPLFPGYVFARWDITTRAALLQSHLITRLIPVDDESRLLRELDQVRTALAADPTLAACRALTKGMRVRIQGGPFQGLEGRVESLRGPARVVLNVEIIGQGVAVEVAPILLERLED